MLELTEKNTADMILSMILWKDGNTIVVKNLSRKKKTVKNDQRDITELKKYIWNVCWIS